MTISGYIACGIITGAIILGGICIATTFNLKGWLAGLIIGLCLVCTWGTGFWYYNTTASGIRARTDQTAELNNGLNRVINVYTADGNLIATYEGKIDLEDNQGGYVMFDWNGKRYTYYNCFVESIANID